MVSSVMSQESFHESIDISAALDAFTPAETQFTYTFENFFHPFVGKLIEQLNTKSLAGLLDADEHKKWTTEFFETFYDALESKVVKFAEFPKKEIDVSSIGSYANYNWELLFHFPFAIAVHLSKNQRFAEAQRWFHYIFDPTDADKHYWKFLRFLQLGEVTPIDEQLLLLSKDELEEPLRDALLTSYNQIKDNPFQPHPVAQLRVFPYQYAVVMNYLDNLIAWGDSLFRQDTVESINEATQLYVLAANILGTRPQRIPPRGTIRPKTFHQLKYDTDHGLDEFRNALVELEGQFPFNFSSPSSSNPDASGPFGGGQALYFCIPPNDKLLGYWDTVADRLFKIRHCMNIEGVVRQLALFDPPIDPGMLVKAAAGISIGSILSGLNQPISPVRSLFLIQKALELVGEVRGLGSALLSAIEKGDGEKLALLRQSHEIKIQNLSQEVRFLQWKQAQESTESLLKSRASALERYRYYLRLLNLTPDSNAAPDTLPLDRRELTEENFDEAHNALVAQYEKPIPIAAYPHRSTKEEGTLRLLVGEYDDLNVHSDSAQAWRERAAGSDMTASGLAAIPAFNVNMHFWGLGASSQIAAGQMLADAARAVSAYFNIEAQSDDRAGQRASKTASYERRADDWTLQANLAARELMQIGRQILGSLITEQFAHREYENVKRQIEYANEVDRFLRGENVTVGDARYTKFTTEELYAWMQGELMRLYYEYYRFAFDTARKAEQTMKRELMRPEVDSTDYVKFNYWDGGRKGLLSGEALYLDIKRMEMAYHENNKREFELTKHVSLRQLNPLALLTLKATGSCEVSIPEWLYDLDCAGHYMRRIKNVSLSIPLVAGPYTNVSCTLSLLKSSLRKSPLLADGEYPRQPSEDNRFVDYFGTIQSIVTSGGNNDSGMFETNLRDERFLPFEGAGAESKWKLELPASFRQFDYNTISDVILHIRYTARQGGAPLADKTVEYLKELVGEANAAGLTLLFSLKHDFPSEWHRFTTGTGNFEATVKRDHFPYFTRGKQIAIDSVKLHAIKMDKETFKVESNTPPGLELMGLADALNDESEAAFVLSLTPDPAGPDAVLERKKEAIVFVSINYSLTS
jgi:Tc toxin complex TcA C-terminal TcB-binding domain